jgi:hypothetical protein
MTHRCTANTLTGMRCRNNVESNNKCWQHQSDDETVTDDDEETVCDDDNNYPYYYRPSDCFNDTDFISLEPWTHEDFSDDRIIIFHANENDTKGFCYKKSDLRSMMSNVNKNNVVYGFADSNPSQRIGVRNLTLFSLSPPVYINRTSAQTMLIDAHRFGLKHVILRKIGTASNGIPFMDTILMGNIR